MWSLGIVLYILLTGKAPYYGNDDDKIISQVKKGNYNKKLLVEAKVSKQAITLLEKLLQMNPKKRLSAEEALQDPWILKNVDKRLQIDL